MSHHFRCHALKIRGTFALLVLAQALTGCMISTSEPEKSAGSTAHSAILANANRNAAGMLPLSDKPVSTPKISALSYAWKMLYLPPPAWIHPAGFVVTPEFQHAEIADVTGDGRKDLVSILTGLPDGYKVVVQAQSSDGILRPAETYTLPEPLFEGCRWLKIGDLNGDGIQDPIVVRARTMFALLSQPSKQKSWAPLYSTPFAIDTPPIIDDLNNDGFVDIALHLSNSGLIDPPDGFDIRNRLVFLLNDGSGHFRTMEKPTYGVERYDVENATGMTIGDFNNDGFKDVALRSKQFDYWGQHWNHGTRIYRQNFNGIFSDSIEQSADPFADKLISGDFNGDGLMDLGITNDVVVPLESKISMFFQLGDGNLSTAAVEKRIGLYPTDLDITDLDQDGKQDILVAHLGSRAISYFLLEQGILSEERTQNFSYGDDFVDQTSQAAGDLDGDGCPEVAVAMRYDGLLVMKGNGCSPKVHRTSGPMPALPISTSRNNAPANRISPSYRATAIPGISLPLSGIDLDTPLHSTKQ